MAIDTSGTVGTLAAPTNSALLAPSGASNAASTVQARVNQHRAACRPVIDERLARPGIREPDGGGMNTITVAGGNLFAIAAQQYGDATAWLQIARANGLSDPFLSGLVTLTIPPYDPTQSGGVAVQ